ncbi:hypothetical protein AAFF_G00370840 [Aldrovandia affinis]|uniref:Uncharacterized protein n=1 Tax=Aldrovandia affinis TaxID=143900 RepID=A0AAD7SGN0_9TELE|nr:hypothetical protein AAFF_G00370840 [Aldrovandia affinis]
MALPQPQHMPLSLLSYSLILQPASHGALVWGRKRPGPRQGEHPSRRQGLRHVKRRASVGIRVSARPSKRPASRSGYTGREHTSECQLRGQSQAALPPSFTSRFKCLLKDSALYDNAVKRELINQDPSSSQDGGEGGGSVFSAKSRSITVLPISSEGAPPESSREPPPVDDLHRRSRTSRLVVSLGPQPGRAGTAGVIALSAPRCFGGELSSEARLGLTEGESH